MKQKVVYKDADYTKVVYGEVEYDNPFVIVKQAHSRVVRIGAKFVISITPVEDF